MHFSHAVLHVDALELESIHEELLEHMFHESDVLLIVLVLLPDLITASDHVLHVLGQELSCALLCSHFIECIEVLGSLLELEKLLKFGVQQLKHVKHTALVDRGGLDVQLRFRESCLLRDDILDQREDAQVAAAESCFTLAIFCRYKGAHVCRLEHVLDRDALWDLWWDRRETRPHPGMHLTCPKSSRHPELAARNLSHARIVPRHLLVQRQGLDVTFYQVADLGGNPCDNKCCESAIVTLQSHQRDLHAIVRPHDPQRREQHVVILWI
mmetsp:Transcript_53650/g.131118  ORF Transcript_53650/g.131118 Transcript_53650/m.131118 type:complete len:269 (-) Transcript_53650:1586-2392(-)